MDNTNNTNNINTNTNNQNIPNPNNLYTGKWMVTELNSKNAKECEWKLILSQSDTSIRGFANFTPDNFCRELSQKEKDFIGSYTIEAQANIKDDLHDIIHFNLAWRSTKKDGTQDSNTSMDVKLADDNQSFEGTWKNYSSGGKCYGKRI